MVYIIITNTLHDEIIHLKQFIFVLWVKISNISISKLQYIERKGNQIYQIMINKILTELNGFYTLYQLKRKTKGPF